MKIFPLSILLFVSVFFVSCERESNESTNEISIVKEGVVGDFMEFYDQKILSDNLEYLNNRLLIFAKGEESEGRVDEVYLLMIGMDRCHDVSDSQFVNFRFGVITQKEIIDEIRESYKKGVLYERRDRVFDIVNLYDYDRNDYSKELSRILALWESNNTRVD